MATNKGFKNLIKNMLGDKCDDDTMCTLMACAPLLTRCTEGKCKSYDDPTWGIPTEK